MPKSENPKTLANADPDDDSLGSLGSLPDDDKRDKKKKSKSTSITPSSKKKTKKKETSLLDLVNNLDTSNANAEPKFNIADLLIFEDDNSVYTNVKEYLKQFKDPKESVQRLYSVPYFLMNPEPSDWNFFGNTLYLHTALAIFNKLDVNLPFVHTLNKTITFLYAISELIPQRFSKFLESYNDDKIMRL